MSAAAPVRVRAKDVPSLIGVYASDVAVATTAHVDVSAPGRVRLTFAPLLPSTGVQLPPRHGYAILSAGEALRQQLADWDAKGCLPQKLIVSSEAASQVGLNDLARPGMAVILYDAHEDTGDEAA